MPRLALAILLLFSQAVTPTAPVTKTYHNTDLHLSFEYPASFQTADFSQEIADEEKKQLTDPGQMRAVQCVTNPFVAAKDNTTSVILIIRLDLNCLKLPSSAQILPTIARSSISQGLSKLGRAALGTPTPYKLDSYDALFIPASAENESGKSIYFGGITCVLVAQNIACWSAMSSEKATVSALLSNSVTFDGQPAHPVVPPELLPK
jgi:hypothetical protein